MDEIPDAKASDVLDDREIDEILVFMTAIALRDHGAVEEQGTLPPDSRGHFWTEIDADGGHEFRRPLRQDVEDAWIVAFSDGRGYAVDVDLRIADAGAGGFSGPVVCFEVLRGAGKGVYLHYAHW